MNSRYIIDFLSILVVGLFFISVGMGRPISEGVVIGAIFGFAWKSLKGDMTDFVAVAAGLSTFALFNHIDMPILVSVFLAIHFGILTFVALVAARNEN